ncbi:MAG TPA: hypothetical protein VMX75_00365 [Spirochaetia bacterium]|nr:hypothetical protein [Spirochaetia bacterium]
MTSVFRILFVGNSHTYFNAMPVLLSRLAHANGKGPVETKRSVGSGVDLEWHWHNGETRRRIADGSWDYVVLQDRSGGPLENHDSFTRHARFLAAEIKEQGSRVMFYMTWANYLKAETQDLINRAYVEIAAELNALLAPVGMAWQNLYRRSPHPRLHAEDNRHANFLGSYMTSCVFYAVLFDSAPEIGLKDLLSSYSKEDVEMIHRTALETVQGLTMD